MKCNHEEVVSHGIGGYVRSWWIDFSTEPTNSAQIRPNEWTVMHDGKAQGGRSLCCDK